jgi:hypothetical protein
VGLAVTNFHSLNRFSLGGHASARYGQPMHSVDSDPLLRGESDGVTTPAAAATYTYLR